MKVALIAHRAVISTFIQRSKKYNLAVRARMIKFVRELFLSMTQFLEVILLMLTFHNESSFWLLRLVCEEMPCVHIVYLIVSIPRNLGNNTFLSLLFNQRTRMFYPLQHTLVFPCCVHCALPGQARRVCTPSSLFAFHFWSYVALCLQAKSHGLTDAELDRAVRVSEMSMARSNVTGRFWSSFSLEIVRLLSFFSIYFVVHASMLKRACSKSLALAKVFLAPFIF